MPPAGVAAPAADPAPARVLALPSFRCRRFVVPSFTPYPTSTACRSTFGAGLPWIPGSKAACSGDSAPAGVEVAAVTGSARSACCGSGGAGRRVTACRPAGGGRLARFLGGGRPPGPGVSFGAHVDRDDRRPHVDGRPSVGQQLRDDPLVRAGQLHHGLGRFDLHDHLVERHRVARLDVPGDDVRLGQALTDVREPELLHLRHPLASQYANVRSTASSTRSRSGR